MVELRIKQVWILTGLSILIGCSSNVDNQLPKASDYQNAELLIDVLELKDRLESNDDLFLIDTRTTFSDYSMKHIPGAIYFHARKELNDTSNVIEHFMVNGEVFEEKMQVLGVNSDSRLVIYDEGNSLGAARLFYALEYYGFQGDISILNGGYAAWSADSLTTTGLENQTVSIRSVLGNFVSAIQEDKQCDLAYVTGVQPGSNKIIFDVRSKEEFDGEDVRSEQGGHIPGAIHLEWSDVLVDGDVPTFLAHDQIQEIYESLGVTRDKEIIPHCHTNVRGSHAYFTLRLMGYDSVRPFEGSWSEYGNAEGVTVAK